MGAKRTTKPGFEITPTDFELMILGYMKEMGKKLTGFEAVHNANVEGLDGDYSIDVKVTFEALNCAFTVLIECKRYSSSIKRELVQILHDKVRSTGSHKGIIFSTSQFQAGAKEYARSHGIALVRVQRNSMIYVVKDASFDETYVADWIDDAPRYKCQYIDRDNIHHNMEPGWLDGLKEFLFPE